METLVGRQTQISQVKEIVTESQGNIINIFGVGGIGKTSLCNMLVDTLQRDGINCAYLNAGAIGEFQIDRLLGLLAIAIEQKGAELPRFMEQHSLYLEITKIDEQHGGVSKIYGVSDSLEPEAPILDHIQAAKKISDKIKQSMKQKLEKRHAYEQYLRGANDTLLEAFKEDLEGTDQVVIVLDGYEKFEFLDDEIRKIIENIYSKHVFILVGRNQLRRIDFQWRNYDIQELELIEFTEDESIEYLSNHGLNNKHIFDEIYQHTGGYPLALDLTADLASFAGWENINLSTLRDMDQVAQGVLDRIIEEMASPELSKLVELGPVASWIDPEIIVIILEVSPEEASAIYNRLSSFSFMEYHQNGLKFHDRIREILVPRLKFRKKMEFIAIVKKLREYYEALELIEG